MSKIKAYPLTPHIPKTLIIYTRAHVHTYILNLEITKDPQLAVLMRTNGTFHFIKVLLVYIQV